MKNCVVYLQVQTVHLIVRTPGSERPDYEISHNHNLTRSLQEQKRTRHTVREAIEHVWFTTSVARNRQVYFAY